MNDSDLLLAIQERLDGVEWTNDTFEEIAQLMVNSGYRIRDCNDVDRDAAPALIGAEAHSDDRAIEIDFDAVDWFKQASVEEIVALAACEWGGDYPADAVADLFAAVDTAPLFAYLNARNKGGGETVGFECHVDGNEAMAWLRIYRPDVVTAIEYDAELRDI
jgi:hypothetical protein